MKILPHPSNSQKWLHGYAKIGSQINAKCYFKSSFDPLVSVYIFLICNYPCTYMKFDLLLNAISLSGCLMPQQYIPYYNRHLKEGRPTIAIELDKIKKGAYFIVDVPPMCQLVIR